MKKFVIIFLLAASYLYSADEVRNYNEQISFIFELSDKFTISEIGTLQYPEHNYTMYKITYGSIEENGRINSDGRNYLFLSGIHGNETAPVYEMKEYMQHLDSIAFIDNLKIDFICIVNPYGFEHDSRHNGDGIDINRDFISFKTEEARLLADNIKNETYDGVYDFHEHSATAGFLLYTYSRRSKRLGRNILEHFSNNNIPLENNFVDVILRARNGIISVPFYAKIYFINIQKQATAGLYFDKMNIDEVFVIETPKRMEMARRREMIDLFLQKIL